MLPFKKGKDDCVNLSTNFKIRLSFFLLQIDDIKSDFAAKGDKDETEINEKIVSVEKFSDSCMSEINDMFAKVDDRRRVSLRYFPFDITFLYF